ncbi:MAG: RNA polymerase sigma factor [Phycisphaerales bacterium JB043]
METQKAKDEALMARIANGQEGAVEELYDRFGSLVYRMAYQMLPSKSDAEDAVQEVFVRLWKTADRFDSTRAALSTWVVLITRRYLVDRLRRSRVRVKAALELQEQKAAGQTARELPVDDAEMQERFTLLMSRIEKLPELQRAVLTRAYLGGQTLRQIGLELDRPIGTIKSTLSRAMVRLREQSVGGEEPVT